MIMVSTNVMSFLSTENVIKSKLHPKLIRVLESREI